MKKFIILNTNEEREAHYHKHDDSGEYEKALPFWLKGDYVGNSSGDTHSDITRAHLYNTMDAAARQADKLTKKFSVNGHLFTHPQKGGLGYRYPDSVGKKGYTPLQPTYEACEVEVSVKLK